MSAGLMILPSMCELETARLRLRVPQAEDTDAVFEAETASLEQLGRWFWWTHPEHKREHCLAWARSRQSAWEKGEELCFLVTSKSDGRILGCTWLNALDRISRRASLGYWLRTGCEGQGYATEATRAVVQWAFGQLQVQRVEIVIAVGNERSRSLAERLGAQCEGVARARLRVGQRSQDAWVYSLLPQDC